MSKYRRGRYYVRHKIYMDTFRVAYEELPFKYKRMGPGYVK
jgi:hypothetical protein